MKETLISRKEACKFKKVYTKMMKKESHHDHEIVLTQDGYPMWKPNPKVVSILATANKNDIWELFMKLGYDRNSEPLRKLCRDMGYSLFGYWEIFYFYMNNPDYKKYKQPKKTK